MRVVFRTNATHKKSHDTVSIQRFGHANLRRAGRPLEMIVVPSSTASGGSGRVHQRKSAVVALLACCVSSLNTTHKKSHDKGRRSPVEQWRSPCQRRRRRPGSRWRIAHRSDDSDQPEGNNSLPRSLAHDGRFSGDGSSKHRFCSQTSPQFRKEALKRKFDHVLVFFFRREDGETEKKRELAPPVSTGGLSSSSA